MWQILEEFYKGGEGSLSKLIFFCQVCTDAQSLPLEVLAHGPALFSNARSLSPHVRQPPKGDKGQTKLTFSNGREDNLTGKCVYFARVNPKGVTAKDVETDVTYGEIVGTPLGSLQSILQDVFQVNRLPSEDSCPLHRSAFRDWTKQ
jgi:hypothetical protein